LNKGYHCFRPLSLSPAHVIGWQPMFNYSRITVHKVKLIVCRRNGMSIAGGYVRDVELPFVPTVGMEFRQGTSTTLWEATIGVLTPAVEKVIYDFDEETIVCLFTVNQELNSAFWTTLDYEGLGEGCAELDYFRTGE
jgi:hypothetical protein